MAPNACEKVTEREGRGEGRGVRKKKRIIMIKLSTNTSVHCTTLGRKRKIVLI